LLKELFDMGIAFNFNQQKQIAAYIASIHPTKNVWTASQVGWFDGNNFVLPDSTIGKDSDSVLFQSESNNHQEYSTAGTLNEWRSGVASLCVNNPLMLFSVSTAFAGALLKLCNMDGSGFHAVDGSSRGKTTLAKATGSVWGCFGKYARTWRATANGMEGAALLFNDGLIILDEIGDGDAKEIADTLYLLGNGKGKQRANVLGNARAINTFRVIVWSNGEHTIEVHLAKKGLTVKAGQLVRFLQILLFGKYGAFDDLHGYQDGRSFADAIVKNASVSYGTAGRAYLEQLTQDEDTLANCSQTLHDAVNHFTERFGTLSAQEARAAKSFAIVGIAGELATKYGVTGWEQGTAFEAALTCFAQWRSYRGKGDTEGLQIVESVTAYIEMYGDARFTRTDDETRLHGVRSGYWRDTFEGRQWLFTKSGLMEATKGYDIKQVVFALKEVGMLVLDSEGKSTTRANFKTNETGNNRFYVIKFTEQDSNTQKQGGTGGTSGTTSKDAGCSSTTLNNERGTGGTKDNKEPLLSTTCTTSQKQGGTAESPAIADSTTCTTDTTEKTPNTNQQPENKLINTGGLIPNVEFDSDGWMI
jgi:putative DNA primase/helicase